MIISILIDPSQEYILFTDMHLGCRLLRESAKRLELNSSCSRNIVRKFTEDTSKNNAMPNIAKESASRNSDSHPPSVGDNHQSIDSKYDHSNYFKSSLDSTKRAATAFTHTTQVMSHDLKEYLESIESSLMIKINQKNKSRFRLYVISALMSIIWVTVVFGENIRNTITEKTADIAKGTLENRELKIQTQELAILVIQAILNDKDIAGHAASFLREVSSSEETQRALVQLTIHVLQHEESLKQVTILAKKLIDNLSKDPETIQQVSSLMVDALADPRIRASLVELIKDLSADPAIIDAVANMSIDVLNKNNVLDVS